MKIKKIKTHAYDKYYQHKEELKREKEFIDISSQDIKEARQRKGMTQEHMSIKMGVSTKTITNWETKGPPKNGPALKALLEFIRS